MAEYPRERFNEILDNIDFEFCRVFYPKELYYRIRYFHWKTKESESFLMSKDSHDIWKIENNHLHSRILKLELDFHQLIDLNEKGIKY